ncbi:hypothetical protein [Streptomyces sp. NPDC018610]|uniref:hypothetical protein n=1 Tax=Streptomyces sp. NPDC018610 TaxID=3365049 RepID=UPI0037AA190C
MSGIGPVEPSEGTRGWHAGASEAPPDAHEPYDGRDLDAPPSTAPPPRAARFRVSRRRALLAAALAALLAGGGLLYATRTRRPPPPAPPFPSQVVDVSYLGPAATPPDAPPRSFSFALLVSVESGPPVTVTALDQPYAGLSLASTPRPPFGTEAGSAREIVITMHVTECGKVPENAGLPFVDVTLRNIRAMEAQSFILGSRYAHALSEALRVACGNDSR